MGLQLLPSLKSVYGRNIIPDPINMTGWSGGGGGNARLLATDVGAPAGCPNPAMYRMGQYDNKLDTVPNAQTAWAPCSIGYQVWQIEGWFHANTATAPFSSQMRWGTSYSNTLPSTGYSSQTSNWRADGLAVADYQTWKWARLFSRLTIPVGGGPFITPNFGGQDWCITDIRIRQVG